MESPFTNDQGPDKGPNSIYELILTDSPLSRAEFVVDEKIDVADVTMDPDIATMLAQDLADDDVQDELSEQVPEDVSQPLS